MGGLVLAASTHLLSLLPDASWARNTEPPLLELDRVESPFRDGYLAAPLDIRDGFVAVPSAPGLGVEVDEEKLRFYSKAI